MANRTYASDAPTRYKRDKKNRITGGAGVQTKTARTHVTEYKRNSKGQPVAGSGIRERRTSISEGERASAPRPAAKPAANDDAIPPLPPIDVSTLADLSGANATDAIALIRGTDDLKALNRWWEEEERTTVVAALDKRIQELDDASE